MNYHFVQEEKFISSLIQNIEEVNKGKDKYILLGSEIESPFQKINGVNFILLEDFLALQEIRKEDKLYFYSFTSESILIIDSAPKETKVYWNFWGADFYSPNGMFLKDIFSKDELVFLKSISGILTRYLPLSLWIIIFRGYSFLTKNHKFRKKFIKRVNYFLHWNYWDFEIVKRKHKFKAEFMHFFMGDISRSLKRFEESGMVQTRNTDVFRELKEEGYLLIQVGNSGYITNNTIEVLYTLKNNLKAEKYKIICPLSYGNKLYIERIKELGTMLFGESFMPMEVFFSKEEYYTFMNHIDIGIFNSKRTQGGSNINALLYFGKVVFLKEENTMYKYLKTNGVSLFTISDKSINKIDKELRLSSRQANSNSNCIGNIFSLKKAINSTNEILNNHL